MCICIEYMLVKVCNVVWINHSYIDYKLFVEMTGDIFVCIWFHFTFLSITMGISV
ncbi:hypothetical protein HanRHA438_Chr01g0019921 [Helianthus annuus]|nr:hypothetical protein HanRHA438_Chr01g0019921 [Helianthus annuus]